MDLNLGEKLEWRDEYMNWQTAEGILLELLSITAGMRVSVLVHMGLCVG